MWKAFHRLDGPITLSDSTDITLSHSYGHYHCLAHEFSCIWSKALVLTGKMVEVISSMYDIINKSSLGIVVVAKIGLECIEAILMIILWPYARKFLG